MRNSRAFTLLELVVVVAIIGLLASLVLVPNLIRFQKRAAASQAKADISQVANALVLSASEGCTSITVKSGSALSCGSVTYLQRVPSAGTGFTYFCGTADPATTDLTAGCTNLDPSVFHQLRITGFTGDDEFKCSEGSCFCTTTNGCTTK